MEDLSPYYAPLSIKPWDYCNANKMDFTESHIIKWISRYKYKHDGLHDLYKARQCIDILIERERAKKDRKIK